MKRFVAGLTVFGALGVPVAAVPHGAAEGADARRACDGRPATIVGAKKIYGTDGDDVIVGSEGRDTIYAKGGRDLVCALGDHDDIHDGPGRDRVFGGWGDDGLYQESVDRDFFDGGPGFDAAMYVGRTADLYVNLRNRKADDGQQGEHDRLLSVGNVMTGSGNDVLVAGREDAPDGHPWASFSDYYLLGLGGDDVLIGGPLGDFLAPGPGQDVVRGRGGRDYIISTDDDGTQGYAHFADVVDGGQDDERDYVVCDELDIISNVTDREGC